MTGQGERYSGEFENDQFHGQGRYEDLDGNLWSGTFVRGELNGTGSHIASDGSRYVGQFRGWRYHGRAASIAPMAASIPAAFASDASTVKAC